MEVVTLGKHPLHPGERRWGLVGEVRRPLQRNTERAAGRDDPVHATEFVDPARRHRRTHEDHLGGGRASDEVTQTGGSPDTGSDADGDLRLAEQNLLLGYSQVARPSKFAPTAAGIAGNGGKRDDMGLVEFLQAPPPGAALAGGRPPLEGGDEVREPGVFEPVSGYTRGQDADSRPADPGFTERLGQFGDARPGSVIVDRRVAHGYEGDALPGNFEGHEVGHGSESCRSGVSLHNPRSNQPSTQCARLCVPSSESREARTEGDHRDKHRFFVAAR